MSSSQLVDIPSFAFTVIPFLGGDDVLSLRVVSPRVQRFLDEESEEIWAHVLKQDFGYAGRQALRIRSGGSGPSVFGTTASEAIVEMDSDFETWKAWKKASWRYSQRNNVLLHAPYFLRAAEIWARLEQWFSQNSDLVSNIRSSLSRGSSYQDLSWTQELKSAPALRATQALFAFYGGQQERVAPWLGLFGGFSAYSFVSCTKFIPGIAVGDAAIAIGLCQLSSNAAPTKMLVVRCDTGHVECLGIPGVTNKKACHSLSEDAVLDWLDEFVRRLETGYYKIGPLLDREIVRGPADVVLHYPQYPVAGPSASRTVTRGVEVVASAVYTAWTPFSFVYSIRIKLLEPNEDGYDENRGFDSCQLRSRHWQLTNDTTGEIDRVDGDGVIGFYPLLREGSHRADSGRSVNQRAIGDMKSVGTFSYQSCTDGSATHFGGHMLFVPGSLDEPAGSAFEVNIDPFPLRPDPDYIF